MGKLQAEFAQRGVKLLALSCNDVESHKGYTHSCTDPFPSNLALAASGLRRSTQAACRWIKDIEAYTPDSIVSYPIIADPHRDVATLYAFTSRFLLLLKDLMTVLPCSAPLSTEKKRKTRRKRLSHRRKKIASFLAVNLDRR